MRISLIIVLCLGFTLNVAAQTKKELKLYQLLEQQKFTKLEKKARKVLSKNKSSIHANFVMSKLYLHKYNASNSDAKRKSNLSKSIRYIHKIENTEQPEFAEVLDTIHLLLVVNAQDSSLKRSINNQYRNWLLVYYNEQLAPVFLAESGSSGLVVLDSNSIRDSLRFAMLKTAQKLKGVRYKYAGTSPQKGFDCSGFTQYVYQQIGIEIPHNAQMQSDLTGNHLKLENLKPGDLIFFGSWNGNKQRTVHAGIVFDKQGDDITVIHCVSGGVSIEGKDSSWDRYWVNRFLFGISMDNLASE